MNSTGIRFRGARLASLIFAPVRCSESSQVSVRLGSKAAVACTSDEGAAQGRNLPVAMARALHDGCVPVAPRQPFAAARRSQTRSTARRMAAVMLPRLPVALPRVFFQRSLSLDGFRHCPLIAAADFLNFVSGDRH